MLYYQQVFSKFARNCKSSRRLHHHARRTLIALAIIAPTMTRIEDVMLVLVSWMEDHVFIVNAAEAENASMIPQKIEETQSRLQKNLVANRGHQKAPRDAHALDHHVIHRHHPIDDVIDHATVVNSIIVFFFRSYPS